MVLAEAEAEFIEAEAGTRFLAKGCATGAEAELPLQGAFIHKVHWTAHQAESDDTAACGMKMCPVIYEHSMDRDVLACASLCWRPGCADWVPLQFDVSASALNEEELEQCHSLFEGPEVLRPRRVRFLAAFAFGK